MTVTMTMTVTVARVEIWCGTGGRWRFSGWTQRCGWGFWKTVKVRKRWHGVFT